VNDFPEQCKGGYIPVVPTLFRQTRFFLQVILQDLNWNSSISNSKNSKKSEWNYW